MAPYKGHPPVAPSYRQFENAGAQFRIPLRECDAVDTFHDAILFFPRIAAGTILFSLFGSCSDASAAEPIESICGGTRLNAGLRSATAAECRALHVSPPKVLATAWQ